MSRKKCNLKCKKLLKLKKMMYEIYEIFNDKRILSGSYINFGEGTIVFHGQIDFMLTKKKYTLSINCKCKLCRNL